MEIYFFLMLLSFELMLGIGHHDVRGVAARWSAVAVSPPQWGGGRGGSFHKRPYTVTCGQESLGRQITCHHGKNEICIKYIVNIIIIVHLM